jgi:hypothetical protein
MRADDREVIGDAGRPQTPHLQLHLQLIFEACHPLKIALDPYSGPTDRLALLSLAQGQYRGTETAQECVLGLFRILEEGGEVSNSRHVRFAELHAALVIKDLAHGTARQPSEISFRPSHSNKIHPRPASLMESLEDGTLDPASGTLTIGTGRLPEAYSPT